MRDNPYVGPRPYTRREQRRFYGRSREARELISLIMAERVVLFYAPSGAGKTSLLNAAVLPALADEGFDVLPTTRVGSDLPPGVSPAEVSNVFVFSALLGLVDDDYPVETLTDETLLSFLRRQCPDEEAIEEDEDHLPLLVFDQFEEIFTTHRERWREIEGFFEQVRDALRGMPSLGIVFAMREDHVAELDPYAHLLPRRLRARFRMERLDVRGALEAVREPARTAGCPFEPDAAERLVNDLRRVREERPGLGTTEFLGPYVEPVQLQVVCYRLWEDLPEQEDNLIRWEDVEQYGDVDRALIGFYEEALERCVRETGVSEYALRRWFGERLITPMQTRGLVLRGEKETGGLPNAAVDVLEARHIIRADRRAGTRWYELSHDRMVGPILRSNREWEQRLALRYPWRPVARQWARTYDDTLLYQGAALQEALDWAQRNPEQLLPHEREFLEASQKAERSRARVRKWRIFGVVMAVLLIVLLAVTNMVAVNAWHSALSRTWASDSIRFRSVDRRRSLILAQMALEEADTVDAEVALRQAIIDFYPPTVLTAPDVDHICNVAYSPDGRHLAATTADGVLQVWDTLEARRVLTVPVVSSRWVCWGVDYSPDGRFIATNGDEHTVRLWRATDGAPSVTFEGYAAPLYGLRFSPDGRYLAAGARDGAVVVWNVPEGSIVAMLTGHSGGIPMVDFSPDGRLLASASWDGTVRVWELSASPDGGLEGETVAVLRQHLGGVNDVAFSPDGRYLASASSDRTALLWRVPAVSGEWGGPVLMMTGHSGYVRNLAFSADSRYLFTGSRDATVRVWDVGRLKSDPVALLAGHTSIINGLAASPDGRYLASGSADHTVRLWDGRPPAGADFRTFTEHRGRVTSVAYSPDGRRLASGDSGGLVRIWSAQTAETVRVVPVGSLVWGIAYSPDGRYLATASADGVARVWDVSRPVPPTPTLVISLTGHTDDVNGVAFSPDGRYLATCSDDETGRLWDVATGETVLIVTGHEAAVNAVAYSPDGRTFATGDVDGLILVWDAASGAPVAVLSGHTEMIYSLAYSPDGRYLASGSWDKTARLWELRTHKTVAVLSGHTGYVYGVAFSPDGTQLATTSWDRTTRLWDLTGATPRTIAVLVGHTDYVPAVAYSPDGRVVATGSRDGTVRRYPARIEDVEAISYQYLPKEQVSDEERRRLREDPFSY